MLKKLMIAALLGAQVMAAAQPAMAAELESNSDQRMGAFGGLRVRVPLDGNARQRQVRAGLAVAPTLHTRTLDGESRLRIGEGLELGLRGREPVRLSIAGQDLRRLGARQGDQAEDDDDDGIPTGAWIAGGLVLAAVGVVVFFAIAFENASDD